MALHKRKKMARPVSKKPSMNDVQAFLDEDEVEGEEVSLLSDGDDVVQRYDNNRGAGSTASAAAPGAAAVAPTEIPSEDESDDDLDEAERRKRSEEKGKGRAVDAAVVDVTDDAATGGVPPLGRDEPPRHGDAAHLGAFHADFYDTESGAHARSPSEEGGSADAGQRVVGVDSNASRYVRRVVWRTCKRSPVFRLFKKTDGTELWGVSS